MRILLLGAASAAALLAPSAASADTAGYLDISAGQTSIENIDLDAISLSGAGATRRVSLRHRFEVQWIHSPCLVQKRGMSANGSSPPAPPW